MRFALAIVASLALLLPALAQDKPKASRGDAKAEKLLKKAWDRVQSAEAGGLTRLKAATTVTATAVGRQMAFEGQLLWKSGSHATWVSAGGEDGKPNPMGPMADIARKLFEPYLAYVVGFESWDVKFKEASFKMDEPAKDEAGKKTGDRVTVTYSDKRVETFTIAENKVTGMSKETMVNEDKAKVEFTFTYEDTGKMLRLNKVATVTRIKVSGLPEEEKPAEKKEGDGKKEEEKKEDETVESVIEGSIEIKKYGKAGEYDIAEELTGSLQFMSMKIPTKLVISEPKVNKDVSDEDLKPLDPPAEEKPAEKAPEKSPEKKPADSN